MVSKEGIATDPSKTEAVKIIPNLKHIMMSEVS